MISFKHIVLTRFNTAYPKDPGYPEEMFEKIKARALSPEWLEKRIKIFETFTLPSVSSQTCKHFKWFLFCHEDTPEPYKSKFESYNSNSLKVVFTRLTGKEQAVASVKGEVTGLEDVIVETQIDNDDAIHREFIEIVQSEVRDEVEFLNIPRGYVYDTRLKKVFGRRSEHNPFRTLVERPDNIRTLYHVVHGASSQMAPIRQISDDMGRWLQLTHGDNLINKLAKKSSDKGFELMNLRGGFSFGQI